MTGAEITIQITFSRRRLKAILALALIAGLGYTVSSQTERLSTAYPAPMGAYKKLIATLDAFLATEGGMVGIGTSTPAVKLDVAGDASVSGKVEASGISLKTRAGQDFADPSQDTDAATRRFVLSEMAKLQQFIASQ